MDDNGVNIGVRLVGPRKVGLTQQTMAAILLVRRVGQPPLWSQDNSGSGFDGRRII